MDINNLFKKSSQAFLIRFLGVILNYFYLFMISQKYGTSGIGIFAFFQSILLFFSIIPKFGLDTSIIKFISINRDDTYQVKNILLKCLIISLMISTLFLFFIYLFKDINLFVKNDVNIFLYLFLSLIPFIIISIVSEVFKALERNLFFIIYSFVLVPLFGLIILEIYDYNINPIISYVFSISITSILIMFHSILLVFSKKNNSDNIKPIYSFKYILKFSYPMLISGSVLLIIGWIDSFMIGVLLDDVSNVGIYNIAVRISTFLSIILFSVNSIVTPKFAEFYSKNDMMNLKIIIQRSTKIIFISTLPIAIIFLSFSHSILNIFGSDFKYGSISLIMLTVGQMFNAFSGSVGYILQMTDREKVFKNIVLTALFINIFLNFILIPIYGINGAAFSSMITLIGWNLSCLFYIKNKLGIKTYFTLYNEN